MEFLTLKKYRYLQVCETNKKQINGVYSSTKISSKLNLYTHKPIFKL